MTDDADTIAGKIRKARTDPDALPSEVEGLEERPEARNLVNIYAALAEMPVEPVLPDMAARNFRSSSRDSPISRSQSCRRYRRKWRG